LLLIILLCHDNYSCPALNLSLELTPSRVVNHDAVLPSALISTISNAYLGDNSKTNPLASPVYAPDSILSIFPPTLMYVSSEDPFLDDSVVFNKRLKRLGVECDLRAARNLPHAYWGLGTAGFPEAKQVQRECEDWMMKLFKAGKD
jgi:acetyl esterase/lipase